MALFIHKEDVPPDSKKRIIKALADVDIEIVKFDDFTSGSYTNKPLSIVQIFDRDIGKENYSQLLKEEDFHLVDKMVDLADGYKSVEKVGMPMWTKNTPLQTQNYSVVNLLFLTDGKGQMSSSEANSNMNEFISLMQSNPYNSKSLLLDFCEELQDKFPNDYRITELYGKVNSEPSDSIKLNALGSFLITNANKPLIDNLCSLILEDGYFASGGAGFVNEAFFKAGGKPDISFSVNTKKSIGYKIQESRFHVASMLNDWETQRNANRRLTGRKVW